MSDVPRTEDWTLWDPSVKFSTQYTDGKVHVPFLRPERMELPVSHSSNHSQLVALSLNDAIAINGGAQRPVDGRRQTAISTS